jgi:hypothetical protein
MSAKTKTFTPKQLARLPDLGYWVGATANGIAEVVCIKNGACKYLRGDYDWSTLLWSCCPTRKAVAANEYGITWSHYADHASMLARFPDINRGAQIKAPNDF